MDAHAAGASVPPHLAGGESWKTTLRRGGTFDRKRERRHSTTRSGDKVGNRNLADKGLARQSRANSQ